MAVPALGSGLHGQDQLHPSPSPPSMSMLANSLPKLLTEWATRNITHVLIITKPGGNSDILARTRSKSQSTDMKMKIKSHTINTQNS
eukprot:552665-Amorphochlora_amoeboformis.AAC.3